MIQTPPTSSGDPGPRRFSPTSAAAVALVALVTGASDPPLESPDTAATLVVLKGCEVDFDQMANLGAGVHGVFKESLVRPGDPVRAGQVIGRLRDQDVRAELDLKDAVSRSDIEIRLSKAKLALATTRLRRSLELSRQRHISAEELETHRIEADQAALGVEEAEHRHKLAQFERRQVEAVVKEREFVAPHDGFVVEVLKEPGESVTIGDKVFRVVNTGRVRVTGSLDVSDAWRVRPGQTVRVSPDIPGAELALEREVFTGKVVFVDKQIDTKTKVCKVTAEVENRSDLLRSGLEARMEIWPEEPQAPRVPPRAAVAPTPAADRRRPAPARPEGAADESVASNPERGRGASAVTPGGRQ
jgi:RND family efflux transporter MFP subunit